MHGISLTEMQYLEGYLRDRVKALENTLGQIAAQKTKAEMDDQEADDADFEGGYDALVQLARKTLG